MLGKWSLSTKFLLILSIPLVSQIVLFWFLGRAQGEAASDAARLAKPIEINTKLSSAFKNLLQMYVSAGQMRAQYFLSPEFAEAERDTIDRLKELKGELKDAPTSRAVLEEVTAAFQELTELADEGKERFLTGDLGSLVDRRDMLIKLNNKLRLLEEKMGTVPAVMTEQSEAAALSVPKWKEDDARYRQILLCGIAIEFLLIALSLFWFGKDLAYRFKIIGDNGYRLASRQPLHATVLGGDEIAQVDAAFHETAAALAQSERREHTIAVNARDIICVLQEKLSFAEVNQASQSVLGYASDELLHTKIVNIIPADDISAVLKQLEQCKAEHSGSFECRMLASDGRAVETRWSVQYSPQKSRYFCVIHDNTERKRAEMQRREVLQMVSHDLKTPLNTVGNVLELASIGSLGEISHRGQQLCNVAASATEQMLTLINDLLDIEKMEAGMLQIECANHPVAELAELATFAVSGLAEKHAVSVVAKPTRVSVYADRDRVVQILTNLLSNAVKFSSPGSEVLLSCDYDNDDMIEFKVKDSGRGIPEKALPAIFDRFRQAEQSDAKSGTGLGLAICKSLVELQGGKIRAQSAPGQGTTMLFTLPAKRREASLS
ncbi:MAG TPA: PAS domain-containing sensor histidine kinase [Chroococcales cyanobacterium]